MGDFDGHPFRGNQYSDEGALGQARKDFVAAREDLAKAMRLGSAMKIEGAQIRVAKAQDAIRKAGGGTFNAGGSSGVSKGDYLEKTSATGATTGKVVSGEKVGGVELRPSPNGGGVDVNAKLNGAQFSLVNTWSPVPNISTQIGFSRGENGVRTATEVLDRYVEHAKALGKREIELGSGSKEGAERGFTREDYKFAHEISKARGGVRISGDPDGRWWAMISVSSYKRLPNR